MQIWIKEKKSIFPLFVTADFRHGNCTQTKAQKREIQSKPGNKKRKNPVNTAWLGCSRRGRTGILRVRDAQVFSFLFHLFYFLSFCFVFFLISSHRQEELPLSFEGEKKRRKWKKKKRSRSSSVNLPNRPTHKDWPRWTRYVKKSEKKFNEMNSIFLRAFSLYPHHWSYETQQMLLCWFPFADSTFHLILVFNSFA